MRTIEAKVFTFDELSDQAKERARQWWREADAGDNYFSEPVIEDAATIADLMGINLRQRPVKLMGGGTRYEPAIYWSGFSSQGDGACFEGTYYFKRGAVAAVKAHAPQDTKLHAIVADLVMIQAPFFYRLAATIDHRGYYYHEHSMDVSVEYDASDSRDISAAETALKEAFSDFARWIYRQLESEWEYHYSDEQVDETITANAYEFTVEGRRCLSVDAA